MTADTGVDFQCGIKKKPLRQCMLKQSVSGPSCYKSVAASFTCSKVNLKCLGPLRRSCLHCTVFTVATRIWHGGVGILCPSSCKETRVVVYCRHWILILIVMLLWCGYCLRTKSKKGWHCVGFEVVLLPRKPHSLHHAQIIFVVLDRKMV